MGRLSGTGNVDALFLWEILGVDDVNRDKFYVIISGVVVVKITSTEMMSSFRRWIVRKGLSASARSEFEIEAFSGTNARNYYVLVAPFQ